METEELDKKPIQETLPVPGTPPKPAIPAPPIDNTDTSTTDAADEEAAQVVDEVLGDESGAEATIEEPNLISKYFPNVEVNEANQAELDDVVNRLEKLLDVNKTLAALFSSDERIKKAIFDWRDGDRFEVAVNRYYDFANLDTSDDPDLETARNQRMENYDASEKRKSDIGNNEKASLEALQQFVESKEMDDDGAMSYKKFVVSFLDKAFEGSLTPEFFDHMYKLMDYDNETKRIADTAREEGENTAANKKIDDFMEKEDQQKGNGLPELGGGGEVVNDSKATKDPFLSDLKRMGRNKPVLG